MAEIRVLIAAVSVEKNELMRMLSREVLEKCEMINRGSSDDGPLYHTPNEGRGLR